MRLWAINRRIVPGRQIARISQKLTGFHKKKKRTKKRKRGIYHYYCSLERKKIMCYLCPRTPVTYVSSQYTPLYKGGNRGGGRRMNESARLAPAGLTSGLDHATIR